MKIKKINIQRFRSIYDQTIECDDQTILIGANGAGKSTVLRALNAFFEVNFKPKKEDYFAHEQKDPIKFTVTFHHFSEDEENVFKSRIHNSEMTVQRSFGGDKHETGTYHGLIRGALAFQAVREAKNATQKKLEYNKLINDHGYQLPPYVNADVTDTALAEWEEANPNECIQIKDDGQFLGFKNVGAGKLHNATNFILVEAVRDASQDASDQKTSAVGQLMDLIVRSAMQQNAKIKAYQDEVNKKYAELTHPANFPELETLEIALSGSLQTYYQDMQVRLKWQESEGVVMPPPKADMKFKEEKFEFPVDRAGNGVQRAFIISLLHQLLVAKSNKTTMSDVDKEAAIFTEDSANDNPTDSSKLETLKKLPSIILAIEEPELYQHPTKQWHFSQVLKKLSTAGLLDVFGDVQVIICTHSPNFVSLSDFHNARIVLKEKFDESEVKHTTVKSASIREIAEMLEYATEAPKGTYTEESTRSRLHIFGTELSEGFFADGVILVEGISDKAILNITAEIMGLDFPKNNIAVLCTGGKQNMDRPWMIFSQLGIPVYLLWDADADAKSSDKSQAIRNNRTLQKMILNDDRELLEFPEGINNSYACFKNNINDQLRVDYGSDYDPAFSEACKRFNISKQKGEKNPYVMTEMIRILAKDGKKSSTIEGIITASIKYIEDRKNAKSNETADSQAA